MQHHPRIDCLVLQTNRVQRERERDKCIEAATCEVIFESLDGFLQWWCAAGIQVSPDGWRASSLLLEEEGLLPEVWHGCYQRGRFEQDGTVGLAR